MRAKKPEPLFFYRSKGEFGFLSNLFPCKVLYGGREFTSSEAAYQFQKPKFIEISEWLVKAPSQSLIAITAHALLPFHIREDWQDVKLEIMREVVKAKFDQNPELAKALLATEKRPLYENSKNDSFWGVGHYGGGQNMLGMILMEVRTKLAESHP